VELIVEELFPDDLFTELVGHLDRVSPRQWPQVLAIAVALRHSWRRDGLARVARRLRVSLAAKDLSSDQRLPRGCGFPVCGLADVSPSKFGQSTNVVKLASNFGKQTQVANFFNFNVNAQVGSASAK